MSSFHAGYAATVCVKQKTAQDILHIYYSDGDILAATTQIFPIPVPGFSTVTVTANMFMAEPQLVFQPQVNNWPGVSVRMYGSLTFSAPGVPSLTAQALVNAVLACPVDVTEEESGYRFSIHINKGIYTDFSADIVDANNPKHSFHFDYKEKWVQDIIKIALLLTPDQKFFFTYPLLSQITKTTLVTSNVATKAVDGALVIGLDLGQKININGVEVVQPVTQGDYNGLIDFGVIESNGGWYWEYGQHKVAEDEDGTDVYDIGFLPGPNPRGNIKHEFYDVAGVSVSMNAMVLERVFDEYARFEIMKRFEEDKAEKMQAAIQYALEHNIPPDYPDEHYLFINDIDMALQDGYFLVKANITSTKGAEIKTDVYIKMRMVKITVVGETGFTSNAQGMVGFKAQVFDVDIKEPDLIKKLEKLGFLAGIITAAFSPFLGLFVVLGVAYIAGSIVPALIESVENKTALQLNQQFGQNQKGVTITLPGTEAPECKIEMDDFVINADGINGFFWFNVKKNDYPAMNPVFWPVDDKSAIPVSVKLPKGYYHPQDTSIGVHWEVFANSQLLLTKDDNMLNPQLPGDPCKIFIEHNTEELQKLNGFKVNCRVYRPWGTFTEDIYNVSYVLGIKDTLDRTKKFVQWGPYQSLYAKYSLTIDGNNYGEPHWVPVHREPKIHKTDIDVRCKMVAFHTPHANEVRYFDELPFPEDQLLQNRHLVCDYCFFGGPDKDDPTPNN